MVRESSLVITTAVGYTRQPDFLTGAFLVQTNLSIKELKNELVAGEKELGRIGTKNKFDPRTIDLDIYEWNGKIMDDDVASGSYLRDAVRELLLQIKSK